MPHAFTVVGERDFRFTVTKRHVDRVAISGSIRRVASPPDRGSSGAEDREYFKSIFYSYFLFDDLTNFFLSFSTFLLLNFVTSQGENLTTSETLWDFELFATRES